MVARSSSTGQLCRGESGGVGLGSRPLPSQGKAFLSHTSFMSTQVPSASSGRRWRPSEASFVPYPEHAWKGQDSKAGSRAGRRTRTFDDISLYKVRH